MLDRAMSETDPEQIKLLVGDRIDIDAVLWDFEPVMLTRPQRDALHSVAYLDTRLYRCHEGMSRPNGMQDLTQ